MDKAPESSDFEMNQQTTCHLDDPQQHNITQHYEVVQQLGDCYACVGKYENARQCYEKATTLGPDEPAPYVGLGVVALQNEMLDDAEIAFRVARRLEPDCPKAYSGLAMVAQQRNDYKQAFDMYLKALELDVDDLTALLGLFQASCQMGSFEKITHYLQIYLDTHPADTSVMFSLAALYIRDGRFEQAEDLLKNVLALAPDYPDAANLLEEVQHNLVRQQHKPGDRIR